MNQLFKDQSIEFEDGKLYSTKALQTMLPRSLFLAVRKQCKSPIQGVFYGKAINQALEKIFLNSMNEPEIADVPENQYHQKKRKGEKKNGWIGNSGKSWFSGIEEKK